MAKKDKRDIVYNETITVQNIEDVMHNSMMPYAEYVVMERALPRVEDGLKPVQRRILYTMMELGNTFDKPHKKSARIAGDTMGKYHPHGDTSIYDAMVRMAQDFSMGAPLVDGHGNFGSIDGDSAAAMRYTEVRLTLLADELLRDIEKDTVPFSFNFDDTLKEPDILPGRFPNLLVNGAMGIAVGLATNIPPHSLREIIDAVIATIDNPKITTDELMQIVSGPDFPTGGIIVGRDGIRQAYETGKGRILLRAKCDIEPIAGGKSQIVITQIPYQVNKAAMLEKIHALQQDRKGILSGISDIRDESDREGLRAVIEIKKDADANTILQYLYKYTDLQVGFGINLVAIAGGKPQLLTLKRILDYYISHQVDVVTRRTRYDLEQAEARAHILEGLLIAIANIDEVIAIIKASQSVQEAKRELMRTFELTGVQTQAILDMRLQRLTGLEVIKLRNELTEINKLIAKLRSILRVKSKLMQVIKEELGEIRKKFGIARRTKIISEELVPEINESDFIVTENVSIVITREGFIKKLLDRAYQRSNRDVYPDDLSESDYVMKVLQTDTTHTLYLVTDNGVFYQLPVDSIPDARWAAKGVHISSILNNFDKDSCVVFADCFKEWPQKGELLFVTRDGLAKRTACTEYATRSKRIIACSLRDDDKLLSVMFAKRGQGLMLVTASGLAMTVSQSQISEMGRTAKGVKAITLEDDYLVMAAANDGEGEVVLISEKGYGKRILTLDMPQRTKGSKGQRCFVFPRSQSNGSRILFAQTVKEAGSIVICQHSGLINQISTDELPIERLTGQGVPLVPVILGDDITRCFIHLT